MLCCGIYSRIPNEAVFNRRKRQFQLKMFPNCSLINKIRENLPFEKGIKDLKVTLADKTVWIKYATKKTTKEQLASAITKLGYQVLGEKQEEPVTE